MVGNEVFGRSVSILHQRHPDGDVVLFFGRSADFFNQRWLDYTGLALEQTLELGWKSAIHPDDLPRILEKSEGAVRSEQSSQRRRISLVSCPRQSLAGHFGRDYRMVRNEHRH